MSNGSYLIKLCPLFSLSCLRFHAKLVDSLNALLLINGHADIDLRFYVSSKFDDGLSVHLYFNDQILSAS